jgi:hypothetical protein
LTGVSLLSLFERFEYEVQLSSFDISQHYITTTGFCWAALTDWKRERESGIRTTQIIYRTLFWLKCEAIQTFLNPQKKK